MTSIPYMQLYVGDYLADTLHLTTEQHGAYLLLLMTMWRHGAALPHDHKKLARIARVSAKRWPPIWAEIEGFFVVDGDTITNHRLTKEHQKAVSISQERKTAASLGGKAKALKDKDARLANGSDLACHSQISEPESDNKRETNVSLPDATGEPAAPPPPTEPPEPDQVSDPGIKLAVAAYNRIAERVGWSQAQHVSATRSRSIRARLRACGGISGWEAAMERAAQSDFLTGRKDGRNGPFFADLDFFLQSKSFTRLMEGSYDNRTAQTSARNRPADRSEDRPDPSLERIARIARTR